jgi:hypothetical protein
MTYGRINFLRMYIHDSSCSEVDSPQPNAREAGYLEKLVRSADAKWAARPKIPAAKILQAWLHPASPLSHAPSST